MPRLLALLPLPLLGCVLPTPLGELPSTTAVSDTGGTGPSTTALDVSASGTTTAPPSMTGDSGPLEPPPQHAWVMRYDEWIAAGGTGGESGGNSGGTFGDLTTGGAEGENDIPAPDTLVVQISTGSDDCTDPHAPLECGELWSITLMIPPELQAPGTYDLFLELSALASESGLPEGDTCSFGAGTLEGTAELFEVGPRLVSGRLSTPPLFAFGTSVEFTAPGC